jgi:hypothetical protein
MVRAGVPSSRFSSRLSASTFLLAASNIMPNKLAAPEASRAPRAASGEVVRPQGAAEGPWDLWAPSRACAKRTRLQDRQWRKLLREIP